jgi:hypothetical protein
MIGNKLRLSTPGLFRLSDPATPAILDDTTAAFSFPLVRANKVTAAFDRGRLPGSPKR